MKMQRMNSKVAITLISILLLANCAGMNSAWKDAIQRNTIQSYEEFIREYPESKPVETARLRIKDLRWERAFRF